PWADDVRVEGPVRNVDAVNAIDQRPRAQLVWREPLARVPLPDLFADVGLGDRERQQTLRADGRFDFFVVDEGRRSAELAVLPDAFGIENGDGLAALALNGSLLRPPAAVLVLKSAECLGEIELLDRAGRGVDGERRRRAAERADEKLLCGIPLSLSAAGRAGVLFEGVDVGHGEC